ncbi:MAG TPA: sigma-54 dependent transcriptional regulator [Gemmatimonadota bacterium]|jgi:DNA-binding NtrC family response regulator|nr:sigma-54 dependent transcriptional regulator [Gemmatimonadota bacterium]
MAKERLPKVLVVEDEPGVREALSVLFKRNGFEVEGSESGDAAIGWLSEHGPVDLVITDLRLPGADGIAVLKAARSQDPLAKVIVVTAQGDEEFAMKACNEGAFRYLKKPYKNQELILNARQALEMHALEEKNVKLARENQALQRKVGEALKVEPVGTSEAFREVLTVAEQVAPAESTVLLGGESGTGKELFARFIHLKSKRVGGPFVPINCGALPEPLLESELFGHVKGSFTGAIRDKEGLFTVAAGGTLFLDEIGDTTPPIQVKLLRVLQEREIIPVGATEAVPVDVRILAATNKDLEKEVEQGAFRQDLYYRLNVIPIVIPPLRERRDDVPLLLEHVLARAGFANSMPGGNRSQDHIFTEKAFQALCAYDWPGNVRELENVVERLLVLAGWREGKERGKQIDIGDLPEKIREKPQATLVSDVPAPTPTMETIEQAYIKWVLTKTDGNKARAAEILGIDPSTLYRKIDRYDIKTA